MNVWKWSRSHDEVNLFVYSRMYRECIYSNETPGSSSWWGKWWFVSHNINCLSCVSFFFLQNVPILPFSLCDWYVLTDVGRCRAHASDIHLLFTLLLKFVSYYLVKGSLNTALMHHTLVTIVLIFILCSSHLYLKRKIKMVH